MSIFQIHMLSLRNKVVKLWVIFITLSNFFLEKTREKHHKETTQKINHGLLSRIKNIKKSIRYLYFLCQIQKLFTMSADKKQEKINEIFGCFKNSDHKT